jgi:hypothetical protein
VETLAAEVHVSAVIERSLLVGHSLDTAPGEILTGIRVPPAPAGDSADYRRAMIRVWVRRLRLSLRG